jgi:hypothetical protein
MALRTVPVMPLQALQAPRIHKAVLGHVKDLHSLRAITVIQTVLDGNWCAIDFDRGGVYVSVNDIGVISPNLFRFSRQMYEYAAGRALELPGRFDPET